MTLRYPFLPELQKKINIRRKILALLLIAFMNLINCGVNTDTPVIPFIFMNPVGVPQVAGVIPTTEFPVVNTQFNIDLSQTKPEFVLKYYVTNTEQQFIGYNLYITASVPSIAETMVGASVYTENGIQPSFAHSPLDASMDKSRIQKRLIANRIPAPGMYPFQKCEIYTFTLRALLNTGLPPSAPSIPVRACASLTPSKCSIGTSCNISACANSACSASDAASCPVGTLCNPCKVPNGDIFGCECRDGESPPGCNP